MNGEAVGATHPAGFWIRLVAFVIDLLVIGLVQLVLQAIAAARFGGDGTAGAVGFFTLVFAIAYPTVLHAIGGQTVGKLLTRVRVIALDGGAVPLGASLLRAIVFWVASALTLGIADIIAGLRKDKRAFHDLLAGTRADRVPPVTSLRRPVASPSVAPPASVSPSSEEGQPGA